jgi:hypothetical protein
MIRQSLMAEGIAADSDEYHTRMKEAYSQRSSKLTNHEFSEHSGS